VLNAVGPYETALRLRKQDNTLLTYDEQRQLQLAHQAQSQQQQQQEPPQQ
jgi:hypothetical protein